jgi:phosphoribosylaminoimidazolecarboxamide formyltransferase / IMP cyclohydrolase
MRALLSVYDKTGLVPLARGLQELGWSLVASGGTSAALSEAGIDHAEVPELTGIPEMLDGRVKTLHPAVHGGILADRSKPEHLADLEAQGIVPIDLVVCNLYPFWSRPSVEMIDIGGSTMVRAAAKNHDHVGIVVDPADYDEVLSELQAQGALSNKTRRRLARAAFAHSAAYDGAIVEWLDATGDDRESLPPTIHLSLELAAPLRYGENPHQRGARYRVHGHPTWWDAVVQHSGTQLSYLNLFDTDAAWLLAHELGNGREAVAVIVKHANPCGVAVHEELATAYRRALECDPLSAFGGVVALAGRCTEHVAKEVAAGPQADVIIAESWEDPAIEVLRARRKSTRLLEAPRDIVGQMQNRVGQPTQPTQQAPQSLQMRTLGGGFLIQEPDRFVRSRDEWQVPTKAVPDEAQWSDLEMAWRVCARTSSNAIVVVADRQAVGVGAGQQSRVEASQLAVTKAGERARGAVAASDAFFPFRDGLDALADAGVTCVVQPGGSVLDAEMVAAADERAMAMVLTSERHFRH